MRTHWPLALLLATAGTIPVLASSATSAAAATPSATGRYLVELADAPIANYAGGVSGLTATKPALGHKLDAHSAPATAYGNYLSRRRGDVLRTAKLSTGIEKSTMDVAFNGFSATLTAAQADTLRHTSGVESRLVAEALTRVPGRLIVAHCDDLREPLPLGPILDGLRILERGGADLPLDPARLDPAVGVLAPYLPALAAGLPPVPPPLHDQLAERTRLLRAMAALLGALAPVVVALEDLHMADPATVEFLGHAAAHPVPGLSLVITTRTDPPPLPATAHRIDLRPLPAAEVGELAATLLDADLPEAFADRLHDWTAGLPFVVEEVVRALKDRHLSDDLGVPPLLRDVLHRRLKDLDEPARDILGAAAVLGRSADEWTLATVLETEVESVTDALSRARDAGLLHESLRFRHALARQVVYDLLPAAARRMLHLRTARVLEQRLPRPVARLAHHYRLAGNPADHVRNAEAAGRGPWPSCPPRTPWSAGTSTTTCATARPPSTRRRSPVTRPRCSRWKSPAAPPTACPWPCWTPACTWPACGTGSATPAAPRPTCGR